MTTKTDNRKLEQRVKRLETFVRKVAYGPPNEGEPLKLLNKFVTDAQKLVAKDRQPTL